MRYVWHRLSMYVILACSGHSVSVPPRAHIHGLMLLLVARASVHVLRARTWIGCWLGFSYSYVYDSPRVQLVCQQCAVHWPCGPPISVVRFLLSCTHINLPGACGLFRAHVAAKLAGQLCVACTLCSLSGMLCGSHCPSVQPQQHHHSRLLVCVNGVQF